MWVQWSYRNRLGTAFLQRITLEHVRWPAAGEERADQASSGHAITRRNVSTHVRPKLSGALPQAKWGELVELVAPKLTERGDRVMLELVRTFTGTPDKLSADTKIAAQLTDLARGKGNLMHQGASVPSQRRMSVLTEG
ncbi:hypothetical protein [Streptomyces hirsutus]|uniref:hypothetical protein n=1 Tax=Streptomyces hirsutus TaxID=35620 RepID=UPI00332F4CF5